MSDLNAYKRRLCPFLTLLAAMIWLTTPARGEAGAGPMSQGSDSAAVVPVDEFSPSFLGVYRKVMEIEDEIVTYAAKYKVDVALARAVCMYESGGNPDLTSVAGARGYFQVMPSTFRLMRVPTNIEAGIKYLGQLVRQFGREDYALAAYNGGPTRVGRRAAMPLESLQYVLGVGTYRSVLKMYEPSVRVHVAQLRIDTVQPGEDWWGLSRRLQVPLVQLRFYNPFLARWSIPSSQGRVCSTRATARRSIEPVSGTTTSSWPIRWGWTWMRCATPTSCGGWNPSCPAPC
jgi:hypothetical protein